MCVCVLFARYSFIARRINAAQPDEFAAAQWRRTNRRENSD
jgi:hypothetical protein